MDDLNKRIQESNALRLKALDNSYKSKFPENLSPGSIQFDLDSDGKVHIYSNSQGVHNMNLEQTEYPLMKEDFQKEINNVMQKGGYQELTPSMREILNKRLMDMYHNRFQDLPLTSPIGNDEMAVPQDAVDLLPEGNFKRQENFKKSYKSGLAQLRLNALSDV